MLDEEQHSFVDSLIGQRIGGRYVIERVLRAGGMGVVAAGRYPELDQEVAIKFMRPELAENAVLTARFLREARLAAKVKSPHFVRVFDFGKLDTGVPFLVMEMLAGRDLRDEVDARGALPVSEAVDYVLQAAVGIAEIHAYGIVHRDLKPSNLFIAEAAGARTIKVLDFGISKSHSQHETGLTTTGNVIGTPQYMSPEQIRDTKTADLRTDVWALGVILYELVTKEVPFGQGHETFGEIYGLILHTAPIAPRQRNPALPLELEGVILKCLERSLDARYANVGELAEALRPFASLASIHRIDAVHQTLRSVRPRLEPDSDPSALATAPTSLGETAQSSPAAKRIGSSGGAASEGRASKAVTVKEAAQVISSPPRPQETAMTSSQGARSAGSRGGWIAAVAGVGALGVIAAVALGTRRPAEVEVRAADVAASGSAVFSAATAHVSASASAPVSASAPASASASAPAPASASAPASAPALTAAAAAAPAHATKPDRPHHASPHATAAAPNPADLLLDRK